ncbi:MAG: heat-inducible transcription repressor HrcA [Candidatus Hydrogenedentes bacterium]|nr:heat-inducible transcription repressor HrcA [Candidatus Hydrogenedentota bacterium]
MARVPEPLSEREEQILHAAVQTYIATAEPVGSRTIVKRFGMDISPATVRNVMADLEERGYLQQIHTSSGRVPTDAGYRYYVDHLMEVQTLTQAEREHIEQDLSRRLDDADAVLRQTSHLLALVSHQTGMAEAPNEHDARVRRLELLPVSATHMALLIVDNFSRVHTLTVDMNERLSNTEAQGLVRFLNEQLKDTPIGLLAGTLQQRMRDYLEEQRRLAERALRLLHLLPVETHRQLFLEGATQIFEQPEFRDVTRAKELLGFFEERHRLADLLRASINDENGPRTRVLIGAEARDQGMDELSVVASPYRVGDKTVGVVGVLGPRRMPYSRFTALVDYTADMVGRLLTRLSR